VSADLPAPYSSVIPAFAFAGMTLLCLSALALPVAAAASEMPPPGASSCSGCHSPYLSVETPVPRLVGRPAEATVAAMRQFRAGPRQATVMDRIAKGFSDDEIAAIAAWYAGQQPEAGKKAAAE
jgi:cytochrome c553